jgi:hypothetical protein
MIGYMGSGPFGGFAGGVKGSTLVAVVASINIETQEDSGACDDAVSKVLTTLTENLSNK